MRKILVFLLVMACLVGFVGANTVDSSTMVFEGALTCDGDVCTGTIPMVENDGLGDSGFDVYAKNGENAIFTDGTVEEVLIENHDAWPTWATDTPDWDYYQLTISETDWDLEYFSGAITYANPLSGSINWDVMYASEVGVGAYYESTGTAEIIDGLGGAQAWDMDWSWGSEYVPLEYPGFNVEIEELETEGQYRVTLTPADEPSEDNTQGVEGSVQDFFWSITVTPSILQFGEIPRGSDIVDEAEDLVKVDASGSETASDKVYVSVSVVGEDEDFYESLLEFYKDSSWTNILGLGILEIPEDNYVEYEARLHGDTSNLEAGPKSATIVYTAYGEPLN